MKSLPNEIKALIGEKISGEDLLAWAHDFPEISDSSKFDSVWREKLKTEYGFDYPGSNPFSMYFASRHLRDRLYYIVTISSWEGNDSKIFYKKSDAYNYITSCISGLSYFIIKGRLDLENRIQDCEKNYSISIGCFEDNLIPDYRKRFEMEVREIAREMNVDEEEFLNEMNELTQFGKNDIFILSSLRTRFGHISSQVQNKIRNLILI